jgi:dihydropteroate synthase
LKAGADIINDISGLRHDKDMGAVAVRHGIPVILMHMRGTPRTMQRNPHYDDTLAEIRNELLESVAIAETAGVQTERIILDPGVGFGKRLQDNIRIIRDLGILKELGYPLLIGLSRKSFLGTILDLPVEDRLIGTVAANTIAIVNGADIVRVHDYREGVQMARVIDAVLKNE